MKIPQSLRFRVMDLYMGLICIFPITTMLIDGSVQNKILFAAMFALHIYTFFASPIKRKTVLQLLFFLIQYLFVLSNTNFPLANINLLFYFPFFLMYMYFMRDNMGIVTKWLKEQYKFIHNVVWIWTVIVGISIFVPGCYYIKEGGSLYFGSWTSDIFRLGPSVAFIQILIILLQIMKRIKYPILYMIIPLYCVLMGSSRTYLVLSLLLFLISWYIVCRGSSMFWGTILPVGVAFFLLIMNSSMGDKIAYTLDDKQFGDFWFRVTSSRSLLWELDMKAWSEQPILNQLFGNDIDFTHDVSGKWAHNDFIELICSFGVVGLAQYLLAMGEFIKKGFVKLQIPLVLKVSAVMVWLFNAFFNMHYVYFCAMLCYPFLILAIRMYGWDDLRKLKLDKQTQG